MRFFIALVWFCLAEFLESTPSASSPAATHTVKVGPPENPLQYVPHNITAAVGDVILFEFYPANHSVVKADYMAPCVPAMGEIFYSGSFNDFEQKNGHIVGEVSLANAVVCRSDRTAPDLVAGGQ